MIGPNAAQGDGRLIREWPARCSREAGGSRRTVARMHRLVIVGCAAAHLAPVVVLAQSPPSPQAPATSMIVPADAKGQAAMRSLETQRQAFAAYQSCVAEHRREFDLHSVAADVIRFRDQRPAMERALKLDPQTAAQYPGGVDQVLAIQFARYRSLGGAAGSIAAVQPVASPCVAPGQLPPSADSAKRAPLLIRDSRRVVISPDPK